MYTNSPTLTIIEEATSGLVSKQQYYCPSDEYDIEDINAVKEGMRQIRDGITVSREDVMNLLNS